MTSKTMHNRGSRSLMLVEELLMVIRFPVSFAHPLSPSLFWSVAQRLMGLEGQSARENQLIQVFYS